MADGLYLAMAGAAARSAQLDSIADNLANAETPGFKAGRPAFQAFLAPGGGPDAQYAAAVGTGIDLRPGVTTTTGDPHDVVPEGDGFLAVRTTAGVAYTRNGKLAVDAAGQLTAGGVPVLSEQGHTFEVPTGASFDVGADGSVRIAGQPMERLAVARLTGPIDRIGGSLLAPGAGGAAVPVEAHLRIGERELGNAGALESTVQMISAQRHFEAAMQALQTYRRLDDRTLEVGKLR